MSTIDARAADLAETWLLLLHQLPAKPAYFRVKIWRRLESLGAVAVKRAAYALPATEQSKEDFAWLRREIVDGGGEALVCEASLIDGLTDAEIREMFNAARDGDYQKIAKELRTLATDLTNAATVDALANARSQVSRLALRHAQIIAIDFFDANGRQAVDGLLAALQDRLKEKPMPKQTEAQPAGPEDLKGHVWVTRQGVYVDRIGCAWLIHRFIDRDAQFRFVPARGYKPSPGEFRFDMFEAEFTHEGDRCTFEVLVDRAGLAGDPALRAIAEIVHDIDLKDSKYGREEAAGIARLIAGIAAPDAPDEQRIERGASAFDSLYDSFSRKRR
ncbi:MAG: chromate resistance protein [Betaproteobacteria bacterium]|nr:chromate resistance protein [Betaproteobacteria bacterium]